MRVDVDGVDRLAAARDHRGDSAAGAGDREDPRPLVEVEQRLVDLGVLEEDVVDEEPLERAPEHRVTRASDELPNVWPMGPPRCPAGVGDAGGARAAPR